MSGFMDAAKGAAGSVADRLQFMPDVPNISVGGAAGAAVGAVSAPANGDAPAGNTPAAGGGFHFEPEQIDAVIRRWEDLRTMVEDDEMDAQRVANVAAPGKEFASGDFATAGKASGETLIRQKRMMIDYITRYIDSLKAAKEQMQTTEENVAGDIQTTGGQV